jgi:hypothetical protein
MPRWCLVRGTGLLRGFDKYFGLISGANSYYELLPNRLMLEDNEPYKIPENFYLAWEHFGCKAIRQGDWKLVWANTNKKWELYNMKNDRTETHNLIA